MHPDLSPHLHNEECNAAIQNLLACHKEKKFGKLFGACNEINEQLNRCLRREREEFRLKNKLEGEARRKRIHDSIRKEKQEN